LVRGEVVGPGGPLWPESRLTGLRATPPIFFEQGFQVLRGRRPTTVLVLLIPIADDEAAFVAHRGWDAFEEHLEAADPDLFELHRGSSLEG
jgi:hypothetical protein